MASRKHSTPTESDYSLRPTHGDSTYSALLRYFSHPVTDIETEHADPRTHADVSHHDSLRAAAVLIAVTRPEENNNSKVVLTLRSENLNSHAGQVSLPGGTCDQNDCDATATALREAEEEIGLDRRQVEVIGHMGDIALPSGFLVTPVVGLIDSGLSLTPCPDEVADIFYPPLELLLNPNIYTSVTAQYPQGERTILELPYEGYRIWGVTAAILHSLARKLQV